MRIKGLFQDKSYRDVSGDMSAGCRLGFTVHLESEELVIDVQDIIGDPWAGLDSASLVPIIRSAKGRPIAMMLDTPGGNVFDAVAVYSTLVEHDAPVRADIIGQAASAGTILASAADRIRIAPAGEFMIHNSWMGMVVMGNATELRAAINDVNAMANRLEGIDHELNVMLSDRSGIPLVEIKALVDGLEGSDGTYFTGQEAVDRGFADELLPTKQKPQPKEQEQYMAAYRKNAIAIANARLTNRRAV